MKTSVIIGHSSGIGYRLTQLLAESNKVYGTYNSKTTDFQHPNVVSVPLDVLSPAIDFDFLPDTIDGLVYCPGAIHLKPFLRLKEEDFIRDYQLQVLGAVKVIQHLMPKLKQSNKASIVLFSTVAVQMGFNYHSLVSASKGAIEGLTRALAAEFSPTVRVNCIAPSITNTPLASSLLNTPDKLAANEQRHPLKHIGEAEDSAQMAAFLLSDASKWITGQVFTVDGGISSIKS